MSCMDYIISIVSYADENNSNENTAKCICTLDGDELTEMKKYMVM